MSENNIKHFETLWEEAEKLSEKMYGGTATEELVKLISESLTNYFETTQLDSKEIADSLKNKHMGEIVFMITALSLRDNVNVYAALQEQCVLRNIG
jgi:phage-related tail protein